MAATMFELRPIPGPKARRLGGDRRYSRAFDRDPLTYTHGMFQAYGPVSALVGGDARLVFALGAAANEQMRSHPDLFAPAADVTLTGRSSATLLRLVQSSQTLHSEQELARDWQRTLGQLGASAAYQHMVLAAAGSIAERWGIGRQLDLVYVVRRLNLRILFAALLGIDTTNEPGSTLLDTWINVLASPEHSLLARVPQFSYRRIDRLFDQIVATRDAQPRDGNADQGVDLLRPNQRAAEGPNAPGERGESIKQMARLVHRVEALLTSALIWPIVLLSQHPRVLGDVLAEISSFGIGAAPATDQPPLDIAGLPLLERVVKESWRLLPPISLGIRQTRGPAEMLGYGLPSQGLVIYSPHLTHQLSGLFVSPRRFRPERWLYIDPSADEYLPLGLEHDAVLHLPFVLRHTKLVLATWLRRARLVLAPATRIDYRLQPALLPDAGISMIVAPRDRQHTMWPLRGSLSRLVAFEA